MDNDTNNQPPANDSYAPMSPPTGAAPNDGTSNTQQPMPLAGQPAQPPQPAPAQPQPTQRPPLRIDHNLLADLGLAALPEEEKKALEKHIYETLEMRVGMRLADQMTNEQLDEFETYFNARDDAGAFRWLETNFPNYKDIVADEFDKLKAEVAEQAPAILAASQQQTSQEPPAALTDAPQPPMPAAAETSPATPQQQPAQAPPQQPSAQYGDPQAQMSPPAQPVPQQWPTPVPPPLPPADQAQPPQQSN